MRLRIVSGRYGGRIIDAPKGNRTHPMSEKMRGALFSALGEIKGKSVLDTYSGSGALAIEAASRGASQVVALEHDTPAFRTILANIDNLGIADTVKAVRVNVKSWSNNNQDQKFDVVISDPPYDDIRPDILEKLIRNLKTDGIFVISWPGKEEPREFKGLEIVKNNSYGDSQLVFYEKTR